MPILKQQYNALLERHYKAAAYLDNQSIQIDEREKWVPSYRELVKELGRVLDKIGLYSDIEAMEGFEV
jgi:hypothetical protein